MPRSGEPAEGLLRSIVTVLLRCAAGDYP